MQTETREVRLFGRDSDPIGYTVQRPENIEEWGAVGYLGDDQDVEKAVSNLAFQSMVVSQQSAIRRAFDDEDEGTDNLEARVQQVADTYQYGVRAPAKVRVPKNTKNLSEDEAEGLMDKLRESHPHLFS